MSSWSPPVTPTPINDLISRYEKNLIVIPEFQRDFVWTPAQIKELIISIYKGYPVGMLIQWETPPETKLKRWKVLVNRWSTTVAILGCYM